MSLSIGPIQGYTQLVVGVTVGTQMMCVLVPPHVYLMDILGSCICSNKVLGGPVMGPWILVVPNKTSRFGTGSNEPKEREREE